MRSGNRTTRWRFGRMGAFRCDDGHHLPGSRFGLDVMRPAMLRLLVKPRPFGNLMTAGNALLTVPTLGKYWSRVSLLVLLVLAGSCPRALFTAERVTVRAAAKSQLRATQSEPMAPFEMTARMAKFIGHNKRGALWSDGVLLGAFEFDSGSNAIVVTMPRAESVACAAWSEDGALLAAVSSVGSAALWRADGTLLVDVPADSQVSSCSDSEFTFATVNRLVFVTAGQAPARLLGERFSVALASDSEEITYRAFSSDGRRLFVSTLGERVRVYDTTGAILLKELPGSFKRLPVSDNGRFLALQNGEDEVDLYDYDSFTQVRSVRGNNPAFHLNMLIVDSPRSADGTSDVVAYGLQPFAKRWERHEIEIYDEQGANASSWRVGGISGVGYSVFDVITGDTLASWRASGFACGYQWGWQDGTLAFLEGDRFTFWSGGGGAKTHSSQCAGTLKPIFSADRTRVLGLDSIWDVRKKSRVARLEMLSMGNSVAGFSRDERLVIGSGSIGETLEPQLIAWSAATGRIVWHQAHPDDGEAIDRVGWYLAKDELTLVLVDTADGHWFQVGILIEAKHGLQSLVFDNECWAGPETLPRPDVLPVNLPIRKCPELWTTFGKVVEASAGSAHAAARRRE